MNINENVTFGSGVGPSGSEVESAIFTPEIVSGSDFRNRIEDLKSRGLAKVSDVQRIVRTRSSVMKRNATLSLSTNMAKLQQSMRSNPTMWIGIAAASGFALGMLGRAMRNRSERGYAPQLIVIETHV